MRIPIPLALLFLCFLFFCPVSGQADQNDPELVILFKRLHDLPGRFETRRIESRIWEIWIEHERRDVNELMRQGIRALRIGHYRTALFFFDKIVKLVPEFAEGWNKRATVHYYLQNYEASLADIERTLALEPRHFGAISGLGLVYIAQEKYMEALQAYEDVLKVHPTLEGAKINSARLREMLEKQIL